MNPSNPHVPRVKSIFGSVLIYMVLELYYMPFSMVISIVEICFRKQHVGVINLKLRLKLRLKLTFLLNFNLNLSIETMNSLRAKAYSDLSRRANRHSYEMYYTPFSLLFFYLKFRFFCGQNKPPQRGSSGARAEGVVRINDRQCK